MPIRYLLGLATCFGVLASLLAAPARIRADEQEPPDDEDKAPTTKISLQARSAPRPALRYRLLPTLIDLKPGNAAVYYNKAALMYAQTGDQFKELQKLDGWMQLPLDKFPQADVAEYLARYERVLREVGFAAHREQCDLGLVGRAVRPALAVAIKAERVRPDSAADPGFLIGFPRGRSGAECRLPPQRPRRSLPDYPARERNGPPSPQVCHR